MQSLKPSSGVGAHVSAAVGQIRASALAAALAQNDTRQNAVNFNNKFAQEVGDACIASAQKSADATACEGTTAMFQALTTFGLQVMGEGMAFKAGKEVDNVNGQIENEIKFTNAREGRLDEVAAGHAINDEAPAPAAKERVNRIISRKNEPFKGTAEEMEDAGAAAAIDDVKGPRARDAAKLIREDLQSRLRQAQDQQSQWIQRGTQYSQVAGSVCTGFGKSAQANAQAQQGFIEAGKQLSMNNQTNANQIADTSAKGYDASLQMLPTAHELDTAAYDSNRFAG